MILRSSTWFGSSSGSRQLWFLGLSQDVRKGYSAIRVRMRVKTNAEPAMIKTLTTMSPVFDTVSRSVPVTVDVETY